MLRFGYTPSKLKESGLLEPEYVLSVFYPGSKLKRWWLARRRGGSRPSPPSPIEGKGPPIVVAKVEATEVEAEKAPADSEERAKEAVGGVSSA